MPQVRCKTPLCHCRMKDEEIIDHYVLFNILNQKQLLIEIILNLKKNIYIKCRISYLVTS